jgi:hypothetical protein
VRVDEDRARLNGLADEARLEKWLVENADGLWPSWAARDIMRERLRARSRAPRVAGAAALVVLVGWAMFAEFYLNRGHNLDKVGPLWQGAFTAAFLGVLAFGKFLSASRADRKIAAGLPRRLSRSAASSVRSLLGTARYTYVIVSVPLGLAAVVTGAVVAGGVAEFDVSLAVLLYGSMAVGLFGITRRLTVAGDPSALSLDERVRSVDAYRCVRLAGVPVLFGLLPQQNGLSMFLSSISAVVVIPLFIWAEKSPPWRARTSDPPVIA